MNERDRVLQVMQSEGMNAKQFCQEVGISHGTLSNIMGGRNKPSLDVMQAILRRFRAVNCDWLIMGVGTMYVADAREKGTLSLFDNENEVEESVKENAITQKTGNPIMANPSSPEPVLVPTAPLRTVSKMLIFYSDGTFEER